MSWRFLGPGPGFPILTRAFVSDFDNPGHTVSFHCSRTCVARLQAAVPVAHRTLTAWLVGTRTGPRLYLPTHDGFLIEVRRGPNYQRSSRHHSGESLNAFRKYAC